MAAQTVFISGAQWVPVEFFDIYYRPALLAYIADGYRFNVGGAKGVDTFAQQLLAEQIVDAAERARRVTVFDKGTHDGRFTPDFTLVNGCLSYPSRDLLASSTATKLLCVLPQFGGGQSGVMVPLLAAMNTPMTPESILTEIREHSESYQQELIDQVTAIYKAYYTKVCEAALSE